MSRLQKVVDFLKEIGISVRFEENVTGFLEHIRIENGGLVIDPAHAQASSVLHEAGHLAGLPKNIRHLANGSLKDVLKLACEKMGSAPIDSPYFRAVVQATDPEATAWAWAAGKHLELPEEEIIQDHEYDNDGAVERMRLGARQYYGINGLQNAGFCVLRKNPYRPDLPEYPKLAYWLQPMFDEVTGEVVA